MLFYAHKKRTNVLFNPRKGLIAMQGEFQGSFGDFLAMKRKEANLTIKDVARWLHISTAYYCYFETGERKAPERIVRPDRPGGLPGIPACRW